MTFGVGGQEQPAACFDFPFDIVFIRGVHLLSYDREGGGRGEGGGLIVSAPTEWVEQINQKLID